MLVAPPASRLQEPPANPHPPLTRKPAAHGAHERAPSYPPSPWPSLKRHCRPGTLYSPPPARRRAEPGRGGKCRGRLVTEPKVVIEDSLGSIGPLAPTRSPQARGAVPSFAEGSMDGCIERIYGQMKTLSLLQFHYLPSHPFPPVSLTQKENLPPSKLHYRYSRV